MTTLAFQNKTILITGSASGMGFLLASHISQAANVKVILVDVDKEKLIRAKRLLSTENNQILAFKIDLSKPNEVDYLCQSVEEKHGYIDMLINNAGIVNGLYLKDLTNEQIQKNFQINTITPIVLSKFLKITSNLSRIRITKNLRTMLQPNCCHAFPKFYESSLHQNI